MSMFFCLASTHLLNKPKIKDQVWLVYKPEWCLFDKIKFYKDVV